MLTGLGAVWNTAQVPSGSNVVVIGTGGVSRHLNRSEGKTVPFRELSAPIDYIGRHFASDISVAALAEACNISVSALERRFRKHLGKTPRQYINEVRLEHARKLLLETDSETSSGKRTGFIS